MCLLHKSEGQRANLQFPAPGLEPRAHGKCLRLMSHLQGHILWLLMVILQRGDTEADKAEETLRFDPAVCCCVFHCRKYF